MRAPLGELAASPAQFAHRAAPCWEWISSRPNRDAVEQAIRDKGVELDLDALLALDAEVRGAQDRDRGAAGRAQRHQRPVQGARPEEKAELGRKAKEAGARAGELEGELATRKRRSRR